MSSKVDSNDDENRKQQQIPVIDDDLPDPDLKIILLGDSAVGKSKLVERFLMDEYNPRQLSTYALTLFRKKVTLEDTGEEKTVDFWDTAGQESFNRMHPSYYYRAHCCILVFDVTRKVTYQHLADWYKEFRAFCEFVPCVLVANKIDVDYNVTKKEFKFAAKHDLPFFFVSAADGTNVVKIFQSAILEAKRFKDSGGDFLSTLLETIEGSEDLYSISARLPMISMDIRNQMELLAAFRSALVSRIYLRSALLGYVISKTSTRRSYNSSLSRLDQKPGLRLLKYIGRQSY